MKCDDISEATNPDRRAAPAALKRAALMARRIAIQTGTAIITAQDGRIVRTTGEELRQTMAATETPKD